MPDVAQAAGGLEKFVLLLPEAGAKFYPRENI